jgi:hypothetical protein
MTAEKTLIMKLHMYESLDLRCISIEITIGEKQYSLWYQHKKNYTWQSCNFFTSAVIMGVQMGEMSKLGWLIGWSSRDMWADSLYFLYMVLGSLCKTFASFQHIVVYLRHARTVTSKHPPTITQQLTKQCFLRAELSWAVMSHALPRLVCCQATTINT